jgi:hypothetical protein
MSTSAASAAASGLLNLSEVPTYSSCSAAALGIVLSMRWLQTQWERAQKWFQDAVREQGRVAIVESERWAWQRLQEGVARASGPSPERARFRRTLVEGRDAVEKVRRVVGGL